ncbi:MAG: hypothetical protein ABL876_18395 [Chitinophagaceae bacterium]
MKLLKLTDLVMQVAILAGGLAWYILSDNGYGLFFPYFVIGGWQLASFFIHLWFNPAWLCISYRNAYGKTILWAFIIGLLCYMAVFINLPFIFIYLAALLFISPAFAIWYFIIGITEWSTIRNKELVHLK